MAELLFYQEPVLLNRNEHRKLRVKKMSNLDFARNVNSVPISGPEFFEASRELPVVFAKVNNDELTPFALLSFQPDGNSLVDDWGNGYMPAFIRRYPFAFTGDNKIIFDKQAPHLQEDEGDLLFKEDGENTELLDGIVRFLRRVDGQFKLTREYCQACVKHELFVPFKAQVTVEKDKAIRLDSLFVINEEKLNALPDEQVKEWFRKGWLAWSYAHLHSLGAVPRLVRREREAGAAQAADPAKG